MPSGIPATPSARRMSRISSAALWKSPALGETAPRAPQAIGVQATEIHALLEVHLRVSGSLERPVPAMAGVHVVGGHGPGLGRVLLPGHGCLLGAVLYLSLR